MGCSLDAENEVSSGQASGMPASAPPHRQYDQQDGHHAGTHPGDAHAQDRRLAFRDDEASLVLLLHRRLDGGLARLAELVGTTKRMVDADWCGTTWADSRSPGKSSKKYANRKLLVPARTGNSITLGRAPFCCVLPSKSFSCKSI